MVGPSETRVMQPKVALLSYKQRGNKGDHSSQCSQCKAANVGKPSKNRMWGGVLAYRILHLTAGIPRLPVTHPDKR